MDGRFVDDVARGLAHGASRRVLLARVAAIGIGGLLATAGLPRPAAAKRKPVAARRKPVGGRCQHHKQCASSLCEATSGTCVAQCAAVGEACGAGCVCQPIGGGSAGNACLQVPGDLKCVGFPPCTFGDDAADRADVLSCPKRPGEICSATGLCSGPEEVCLPLCPSSRLS
jgi:hypothetical protein